MKTRLILAAVIGVLFVGSPLICEPVFAAISADFEPDGDVDFKDFTVLASAWLSKNGDPGWNPACDVSEPNDGVIDEMDLAVFAENWLAGNVLVMDVE